jgi:hypothetical protein
MMQFRGSRRSRPCLVALDDDPAGRVLRSVRVRSGGPAGRPGERVRAGRRRRWPRLVPGGGCGRCGRARRGCAVVHGVQRVPGEEERSPAGASRVATGGEVLAIVEQAGEPGGA